MKHSKNPQADLRLHYRKALEFGTVCALSLIILAFQVLRGDMRHEVKVSSLDLTIEVEAIPPTEQIKRPPPPARPSVPVPVEDEQIPEDETIQTTELNLADVPPPPPPPQSSIDDDASIFVPYDEPPQMIGGMAALLKELVYPELARKAGIQGIVIVSVLVDTDGNTVKTKVLKSDGSNVGFDDAAMKALQKMRWKPAYQRDKPVKVWISIPVRFRLQDVS